MSVRVGRPRLFLRHLRVPAEWRDDEPLLPVRTLSQVRTLPADLAGDQ